MTTEPKPRQLVVIVAGADPNELVLHRYTEKKHDAQAHIWTEAETTRDDLLGIVEEFRTTDVVMTVPEDNGGPDVA